MNEDVRVLFRELADLAPAQREEEYAKRRIPADLRADLESLFCFDGLADDSMTETVGSAAEQFLLAHTPAVRGRRR